MPKNITNITGVCDTCAIAHGYVSLLIIQSKHERGR